MGPKRVAKKAKYRPTEHELVPSDEYHTDDSFNESERAKLTADVGKKRMESIQLSIALLEKRRAELPPPPKDQPLLFQMGPKKTSRKVKPGHEEMDINIESSDSDFDYAGTTKKSKRVTTKPRRRVTPKKKDPDYELSESDESDDDQVALPTPKKSQKKKGKF